MNHQIKHLRPSHTSRYEQGYIYPKSIKKNLNPLEPVIYRSSYEKAFIIWLESCSKVKGWASESISITYWLPDGSSHHYYPDFYVEYVNGDKYIIEIKPSNQTTQPKNREGWLWREWVKNNCKWQATLAWCKEHNMNFRIFTEKTISKLKS